MMISYVNSTTETKSFLVVKKSSWALLDFLHRADISESRMFLFSDLTTGKITLVVNVSDATPTDKSQMSLSFVTIIPTLLTIFIIIGNSMVIGACYQFSKKNNFTFSFILALSLADIATGIGMAFNLFTRIQEHILSYKIPCILSFEVFFTMALISVNLLACTTFDRFLSICKHEKKKKWNTQKSVRVQICCSYLIGITIGALPFLGLNRWEQGMKCTFKDLYPQELYLLKAFSMFLGFGVSFVLYVFILQKAWRVHSGRHIEVLHTAALRQRNNFILAKLVGIITILNTICWLPYCSITLVFGITNESNTAGYLDFTFLLLGFTNSLINPIVYAWNRRDFRALWKKWCRCRPQALNSSRNPHSVIFVQNTPSTQVGM